MAQMATKEFPLKNSKIIIFIGLFTLALALVFLFLKPTYSERKITNSTQLIEPFNSLTSPSQAENILKSGNYAFMVLENSRLNDGDKRPKFNILTWKIEKFEHLGTKGNLTISFFNEKMVSTRFYPSDVSGYIDVLSKKYDLDFKTDTTTSIPPKTGLHYYKDLEDKFYIEWQDEELQEQVDEWIKNYS